LKNRSDVASADWQFGRRDTVSGGSTLGRNLWNLQTDLIVTHNHLSGVATNAVPSAPLNDSGASFVTDRVRPGDSVYNLTTQNVYEVDAVSATAVSFTATGGTQWTSGDLYSIRTGQHIETAAASATADYWTVEGLQSFPYLDGAAALQMRDKLIAIYSKPVQQQSFVLGSQFIRDGNNVSWPLWRPLFGDSFYFFAVDAIPESDAFINSNNRKSTFIAVAMDYTYSNNRLRIVPSTNDSRLDAILAQANLITQEIISTEARIAKFPGPEPVIDPHAIPPPPGELDGAPPPPPPPPPL
jgi:hypothetical protein